MLPLPDPQPGGNLADLRSHINVGSDDDFLLVLAWLLGALRPNGSYPVLELYGVQGSAKTSEERRLRGLIDPSTNPIRAAPRNERDLIIAGYNNRILCFDNLSTIPYWLSDALCRIATGAGFSTRELYTDRDEAFFQITRPIIINGIPELATQSDLADRLIAIELPPIPSARRRREADLDQDFEAARPQLLGALLDAVCRALRTEPDLIASGIQLPRMADFASFVMAAEPALGQPEGSFARAYEANRAKVVASVLDNDDILVPAIRKLLRSAGHWTGTASDLMAALRSLDVLPTGSVRGPNLLPKSANAVSNKLRRLTPALETVGILVEWGLREGGTGKRLIRISNKDGSGGP
jgi:hypothetical protein